MINIGNSWDFLLKKEFEKEYYLNLRKFLVEEYKNYTIYPSMYDIFNALKITDYNNVKVVILGQDPYHNPNQAHGLAFSVLDNVMCPPSLKNIYKEIENDLGIKMSDSGNLTSWAKQGVLLLNTVLTVRENQANSHKGKGWEILTDNIIKLLNNRDTPIVFVLWGANAKQKMELITNPIHSILVSPHPSPLSAYQGFFGCKHFSKINQILKDNNLEPIDWKI